MDHTTTYFSQFSSNIQHRVIAALVGYTKEELSSSQMESCKEPLLGS